MSESNTGKRKGGRVKASWRAGIRKVFRQLSYTYEGNTLTRAEPVVCMTLSLEREPDRVVYVELTETDARKWSAALTVMSDKIKNNEW